MELEEYRRASLETWDAMAPGWEHWRAYVEKTSAPVAEWLVEQLADATPGRATLGSTRPRD
jgi:hypothetical protein